MRIVFRAVPRVELPAIWPAAWDALRPAYERSGLLRLFAPGDVYSALTDARAQLWTAETEDRITTACLTQIETFPRAKVCRIVAIGGDGFGLWRSWFAEIAAWAKSEGCRQVNGVGRDGWQRIMTDAGLARVGAVYSMELEHV